MRIASVIVPRFPLALEYRERPALRGRPVIVGGATDKSPVVVACSIEAERAGVQPGTPLRQALARSRDAIVVDARPAVYDQASEQFLEALERISPLIEPAEPGCVYLGLDGLLGLYPDEAAILQAAIAAIRDTLGLPACAGSAPGKFHARVAASAAPAGKLFVGDEDRLPPLLARTSVFQLPVSAGMQERLFQLGLRTLGDLASLPLGPLQAQFGPEGALAWQLARGEDPSPLLPLRRLPDLTDAVDFPAPTTSTTALLYAAGRLVERLLRQKEVQGRVVRGLRLVVRLDNGQTWQRTVSLREATSDRRHLLFILQTHLQELQLSSAASGLALALLGPIGEVGRQEGLFSEKERQTRQLEEAIRQLTMRLGRVSLARISEVEPWSRIPERRYALVDYAP